MGANRLDPITIAQLKNCAKCGKDFHDYSRNCLARVCPSCRRVYVYVPIPERGLLGKRLSIRERQILRLVSEGRLNKEIAYELHLTENTVKVFLSVIYQKVGARNRVSAAGWWLRRNPPAA